MQRFPDLRFEPLQVFEGVDSVAIHYKGPGGRLAVEVFRFGPDGLVKAAAAYYAS